jgi:hypothetical protein
LFEFIKGSKLRIKFSSFGHRTLFNLTLAIALFHLFTLHYIARGGGRSIHLGKVVVEVGGIY